MFVRKCFGNRLLGRQKISWDDSTVMCEVRRLVTLKGCSGTASELLQQLALAFGT